MTVVINYVSKYISVIATDTRIVYGRDGGKSGNYSDNNEKLISLKNMGWTSGVGLSEFLD